MDSRIDAKLVRPSEEGVRARLVEAGLDVPEECVRGTLSNLIVLQDHVRTLRTFPLDDHSLSALEFRA